ncbi:MAG: polysaccharide deacetylase [Methylocystis sp.]
MIPELMPIRRCAELAGLRSHELVLGVSPSDEHERMLARYRRAVSLDAARGRVVADIRSAVKRGAARRAADLLIVLRCLFAPEAALADPSAMARPRRRIQSARQRRAIDPTAVAQESSKRVGEIVLLFDSGRRRR